MRRYGRRPPRRIPGNEMFKACERLGHPVEVVTDVRMFYDPARSSLSRHIGLHPEIMEGITRDRRFPKWLSDLRDGFREAHKETSVAIGVFCRSGRHRSVACARILAHCLEAEGWQCHTKHLAALRPKEWARTCGGSCTACEGKGKYAAKREAALTRALEVWGASPE